MKLDFGMLYRSEGHAQGDEQRGQPGTTGTHGAARTCSEPAGGDRVGKAGDGGPPEHVRPDLTADAAHKVPVRCPQASPARPRSEAGSDANEINASPVSPPVPVHLDTMAAGDGFDQEAFEERAAIMEFDGGLTRTEAEAAAMALVEQAR